MVKGQLHGMHSGGGSVKTRESEGMSDSTPVKNELIPAGAQMRSAWLVNDGCDFVKFV